MSAKADLQLAIKAYASAAQHITSAQGLVERLQEVSQDVARLPDPQSQGDGMVEQSHPVDTPGKRSAVEAGGVNVHIHVGGGSQPSFPDKQQLIHRLKRGR